MMKNWLHNMICGAGTLLEIMPPVAAKRSSVARQILARSDAEAIYGDWEKIGTDFWTAIGRVKSETNANGTGLGTSPESRPNSGIYASSNR
jgi:hypothetical protein